jgi:hypothetical protein
LANVVQNVWGWDSKPKHQDWQDQRKTHKNQISGTGFLCEFVTQIGTLFAPKGYLLLPQRSRQKGRSEREEANNPWSN